MRRGGYLIVAGLLLGMLAPAATAQEAQQIEFGAHSGGTNDGRITTDQALESRIGRRLDFVRVFEVWDSPFPTAYHNYLIDRGQKMLLSVRAKRLNGSYVRWRDIADAQSGSAIYNQMVTWIERVRNIGQPVWFTFNHEPEVVENINNGTAQDFIDAWRRVISEFRARGVDNVEFVWIMTDWSFHVPPSDRRHANHWYPGDDVVDHIAADAYNWSNCRPGINLAWQSLEQIIRPLRDFGAQHPDKGLMLAEWASTTQKGDKAAWITEARQLFKQPGWEQFIAVSYWSRMHPSYPDCFFPLNSSTEVMDAFAAMASDPFYGGGGGGQEPPPPPPPPPSNLVFADSVDAGGAAAPRWVSAVWTPSVSGPYLLTLDWTNAAANLRFDIRLASNDAWVGANTSTAQPKTIQANLTAGTAYRIAVWSMAGSTPFTVTAQPPGGGGGSNEPPSVSITAPPDGGEVEGTVDITADATDDVAVTQVVFRVGTTTVGTDQNGSDGWSVSWDTTTVPNGTHTITAVASDGNNQTASDSVVVTVDNPVDEPPSVTITSPTQGASVSGMVDITADASDDVEVGRVTFRLGNTELGVDDDGSDGWSISWDTTTVASGSHTITAVATDNNNQTASHQVTVTVSNAGTAESVFTGTVNSAGTTSPRWVSKLWTPSVSGPYVLTLDWSTAANLRFDIRLASNNAWVGANTSTAQPKTIQANLTAGTAYQIAVWSMSGAAEFEVSVTQP